MAAQALHINLFLKFQNISSDKHEIFQINFFSDKHENFKIKTFFSDKHKIGAVFAGAVVGDVDSRPLAVTPGKF